MTQSNLKATTLNLSNLTNEDLKKKIRPIRYQETFQNWAGNIKCKPRSIMKPINEDQIKMIIELSNREKREIRCFGAGHSPSDLACSEDYMINLDELKGEINVSFEPYIFSLLEWIHI